MDFQYVACRRMNYVQAAYVEAAVYINKVLGSDRAYWILIQERVPADVIARILSGEEGRVRHKDRRYATRRATINGPEPSVSRSDLRVDHLTSQRVDVALVFELMLGMEAAAEYLRSAAVPVWVTERILSSTRRRASPEIVVE